MSALHYLGAAIVLLLITAVGIYSGRQVKSAKDFSSGGRSAGTAIVSGSIIGTLVGGASTIGTAQLAFSFGFSAWWFTLGGGIGCLFLAVFFAKPLHESGITTMPQIFQREYGRTAATAVAILTSIGSFLSIVSQMLSGVALITAVSGIAPLLAMVLIVALMLFYVVFGGVWGAGLVGISKTVLLYVAIGACGVMALVLYGGVGAFTSALPAQTYFNLTARGAPVDLGAGLSLLLGVLTTQAYIQAIISAKSVRVSRRGALISAALIPLVGVGSIFVGMYMKLCYPGISPASALPFFILEKMPPILAGGILGTLLIALVGTGAGVSLGLSSMLCNDIYKVYINKKASDRASLVMSRLIIVLILVCAALFSTGNLGTLILSWSFMSMGLRGAVAFVPFCMALFLPGRVSRRNAIAAIITGPVLVLIGKFILPATIDSLFLGVAGAALVTAFGLISGRRKRDMRL